MLIPSKSRDKIPITYNNKDRFQELAVPRESSSREAEIPMHLLECD